ncbi:hypothetical protein QZM26_17760 [Burkholderia multivorans]|nr:hypothetical protein [Burkholderia multivorans]
MKGTLISMLGAFIVSCSGCGGGGESSSQTQTALPSPSIEVMSIEENPVMGRGPAGAWDSLDVLNPSVIEFNGDLINYYSGWDGKVWRTGYASSLDNGKTWNRLPQPILDLTAWSVKYIAANGSAIVNNGKVWYYWHGIDKNGSAQIGLSTSDDGKTFTTLPNPVLSTDENGAWDNLHVSDPYVIWDKDKWFMWYVNVSKDYKFTIGVATSKNGINWEKYFKPVLFVGEKGDWDEYSVGEPSVIYQAPYYYMIYTGANALHQRNIGWALSTDGVKWIKRGPLISDSQRKSWNSQVICDSTIMPTGKNDGTYYVWFGGGNQRQDGQDLNGQIGRMTIKIR